MSEHTMREALQAYFNLTEPLLKKFVFTAEKAGEVVAIVNAAKAALASSPALSDVEAQTTHWDSCWREHHACAIRKVEDLLVFCNEHAAPQAVPPPSRC